MAKKPTRRRRFNLRGVRVTPEIDLLTLASDTVKVAAMTGVAVSTYRVISVKATWALVGLAAGEGPVTVGIAHSDYSLTEIKEALEAAASIDPGNKIAQEQGNRLVRIVGTMSQNRSLNNGEAISTKLNWLIPIGKALNIFVYNEDTAALATGAQLNVGGRIWLRDSA